MRRKHAALCTVKEALAFRRPHKDLVPVRRRISKCAHGVSHSLRCSLCEDVPWIALEGTR